MSTRLVTLISRSRRARAARRRYTTTNSPMATANKMYRKGNWFKPRLLTNSERVMGLRMW